MSRYRWAVLCASLYAFMAFAFALQVVPPLMGQIIIDFNVSRAQAGLLMSMVVIPGIFLGVPAGVFADRYGVRSVGFMATTLIALGCFITAIANSFVTVLIGRLILGIGGVFIIAATPTVISQWFPPNELGKAMGIYGINMPLATVIAFPAATILTSIYNWRYPFYVATAIAILNIVIFTFTIKEGPLRRKHEGELNVYQALKSVEMWKVGGVWFLFNAAALSFSTWAPNVFEGFKGMNPVYASILGSTLMLAAIPCVPLYGWVSDRIGKRKLLLVTGSALMTGFLLAAAYASNTTLIVSIVALGVTAAMVPPVVMALTPEILGPASAGTGFGIVAICSNVGIALAPPFIGFLLDVTMSPSLSFAAMALFPAIGVIVAYTLKVK